MPRWMPPFGRAKAGRRGESEQTLELFVVEGPDAGSQFTVDGDLIRIGRGVPRERRAGEVALRDPTVSPQQAMLRVSGREVTLEHRSGATNPTLVNGRAIEQSAIRPGDRIEMGRTVLEVRSRDGISLSGLLVIPKTLAPPPPARAEGNTTEIRGALPPPAELVVLRGIPALEGQRLPLISLQSRLGRHPSNEIVLEEQGVSRFHAELVWEDQQLFLVHVSRTNPTYVDGERVDGRVPLHGGEEIRLADRVALRIDLQGAEGAAQRGEAERRPIGQGAEGAAQRGEAERRPIGQGAEGAAQRGEAERRPIGQGAEGAAQRGEAERLPIGRGKAPSLRELMEEKVRRDAEIERDFAFNGSFLDLDVVDSHGMKVDARRPEHIIVSFERFRAFASRVVEEHEGQVLNSNGDELMCFFEEPVQAVRAAAALLERLAEFNARENLLGRPFRVREGIHTGSSLVDRGRGVAYSPVLDVAGHLQKHAPVDGVLVSADTLACLPETMRFSPVGEVGRERVTAHRLESIAQTTTPPGEE